MNEEALTVYFSWAKPTEESLRTIDDLSSHEQAKIAPSMYVAMSELPAKTGWLQKTITVRFGAVLAVNAIIPMLSCVFLSMALFNPGKEGISVTLMLIAANLVLIPLSAIAVWWGLMFIRWFDRNLLSGKRH
jgi:hypothetical protein